MMRLALRLREAAVWITPARHLVWSTDKIDLEDPFQRKWYIRQVLTHGRAEDIRRLDLQEVECLLDVLLLPSDVCATWRRYLEWRRAQG